MLIVTNRNIGDLVWVVTEFTDIRPVKCSECGSPPEAEVIVDGKRMVCAKCKGARNNLSTRLYQAEQAYIYNINIDLLGHLGAKGEITHRLTTEKYQVRLLSRKKGETVVNTVRRVFDTKEEALMEIDRLNGVRR